MKITTFLMTLLALTAGMAQAQTTPDAYRIEGRIRGLRDTTVMLAHYLNATSYSPKDTARADAEGRFVFTGTKPLPGGLYLVVPPNNRYVELIVAGPTEPRFSFETDTSANAIALMQFRDSRENDLFYGYQRRMNAFFEQSRLLAGVAKTDPTAQARLTTLQQVTQTYRDSLMKAANGSFTVNLLRMADEPIIPPAPKLPNGKQDSAWVLNYYRNHFFDNVAFGDDRILRTPLYERKLERFIKELTIQTPDSLIRSAEFIIGKASANKDVRNHTIWYLTSQYERPKVLGADALYVHLVEKYWLTKQYPVSDPSVLDKLRERMTTLKPLLVGMPFPALAVSDTLGKSINVAGIKANYTVVQFYSPHCGHCRDAAPKLKEAMQRLKPLGVAMLSVAVDDGPDAWKKFIREFGLTGWTHGYDLQNRTDFNRKFDVATTPTIYILDGQKRIIARALPAEQVEDFIRFTNRQKPAAKPAPKPRASTK